MHSEPDKRLKQIRIAIVSSVLPEYSSAGQIVLHRHLIDQEALRCMFPANLCTRWDPATLSRRFGSLLKRCGMSRLGEEIILSGHGRWYQPTFPESPEETPDVILTVAHGDLYTVAQSYALKLSLPLISIFHDWWPDIAEVGPRVRSSLERSFRDLYKKSDLALCVSPGMHVELGPHPNAHVLYPIPEHKERGPYPSDVETLPATGSLKLIYAGNLHTYGPMLQSLVEHLDGHSSIDFEVRGNNPSWPIAFQQRMRDRGMWLPFVSRPCFESWLESADAFLIPQVFNDSSSRLMRTNFPSKISEMAQFGKPLILWGPPNASGPMWNCENQAALSVTDPNPAVLVKALEQLARSPKQRLELGKSALNKACTMFNPELLQKHFLDLVQDVAYT